MKNERRDVIIVKGSILEQKCRDMVWNIANRFRLSIQQFGLIERYQKDRIQQNKEREQHETKDKKSVAEISVAASYSGNPSDNTGGFGTGRNGNAG